MIEIHYIDKEFDNQAIINNFISYFDEKCETLQFCKNLRNFSRIYKLTQEQLDHILIKLSENVIKLENQIILSQVIKYSLKNGQQSRVSNLNVVLNSNNDKSLQAEILQGLIYMLELTQYQKMESSEKEQIRKIIKKNELDEEMKLQIQQLIQDPQQKLQIFNVVPNNSHPRDIKLNLRLARTRETQLYKQTNIITERQTTINIQKLSIKSIQNMNSDSMKIVQQQKLPEPIKNITGTDRRSWFNNNYEDTQILYKIVVSNEDLLKDEDQKFLTKILISKSFKNALQILIASRMIISIFLHLSKRTIQKRQIISQTTLQQIIQFCSNKKDIINMLYNKQEDKILKSIQQDQVEKEQPNEIEKEALGSFRVNNPQNFFNIQIDKIRCDAIQSIYNLIQIQKVSIDDKNLLIKLQENLKDENDEFKTYSFQLYTLLEKYFDYCVVFRNFFPYLIGQNSQIEECCYLTIREYAKNKERCCNLFKEVYIRDLCSYIIKQEQGKLNRCQLLNICLENGIIIGLDEDNVNLLIDEIFISKDQNIKHEIIKTLLYISKLNPNIVSKYSVNQLATRINEFDGKDKIFKYIIIILGVISQIQIIESLDALSEHLINDEKVEDGDIQITFENPIIDRTVSFIVCQIILTYQQIHKIISKLVIQNLIRALENENTTKLLLARILSNVDKLDIDQETLKEKIFVFIQDQDTELAYYMSIVYTNEFTRISTQDVITEFEFLSKCQIISNKMTIYPNQECKITSNNIFILKNQINIFNEISQDQAEIIKLILERNDDVLQTEVINTLFEIANQKILIHESIIEAIQDLTNNQDKWIKLIELIINNGQSVTHLILEKFVKFLYFNEEYSESAFQILEKANFNQDLPDEIFIPLQIEKAAHSICSGSQVKHNAIKYLLIEVQKGNKLSKNAFKSLETELENDQIVDILIQISKTNQTIPKNIIDKLVQLFNPALAQIKLIQLFKQISNNNQEIIQELIDKLEKALVNDELKDEVFLFFASYGQRDQQLSRKIIQQMLIRLQNNPSQELKIELLNTLIFQIDKIQQDPVAIGIIRDEINQELHKEDTNSLNSLLFEGISKLMSKGCINESLIESLFKKMQSQTCSQETILKIQGLLPQDDFLNPSQIDILQLFKINSLNSKKFFKEIKSFRNKNLIPQNFDKMKEFLKENPDNTRAIINILKYCQNQKEIPQDFLEKIILLSNSFDQDLQNDFQSFINSLIKNKVQFTEKVLPFIVNFKDKNFSEKTIQNIFSYQKSDLIQKHIEAINSKNSPKFSATEIENILMQNPEDNIIDKYTKLIIKNTQQTKEQKQKLKLELTIQSLFSKKKSNINDKSLLKCLSFASQCKNMIIEQEILAYFYQNMLNQKNDLMIRSLSFRGLQSAIEIEFKLKEFKDCYTYLLNNYVLNQVFRQFLIYCRQNIKTIEEQLKIKLDFHQIEILILIPQLDQEIIINNPQNFTIGLIKLILFQKFSSTLDEKQIFQETLKKLNENLENQLKTILQLLLSEKFETLEQILDILKFIQDQEENVIQKILYFQTDPYYKFKQKWIDQQLQIKFEDQYQEQSPFKSLLEIMVQLPVAAIEQLLTIKDNFYEFNQLISFINKYKLFNYKPLQQDQNNNYMKLLEKCQKYILINQIEFSSQKKKTNLIINVLIEQFGWTFQHLDDIFKVGLSTKDDDKQKQDNKQAQQKSFIKVLQILSNFHISPNDKLQYLDIFSQPYQNWETLAYKCSLQKNFTQSSNHQKILEKLFNELKNLNNDKIQENLQEMIQKIKSFSLRSTIFPKYESINNWKDDQIKEWAKKVKQQQFFNSKIDALIEAMAVIKNAIYKQFQFQLTDNQLMSALLVLQQKDKGTLLQVSTGQGKSIIICMVAIIAALEGKKVDIITSSQILAQRDAKKNEKIYEMFSLTCSSNQDLSFQNIGSKKCYDCEIVYGEVSQFQFDFLRDNYLKQQTLCGRSQDFVIVDEVDSMLIDESSKIARLSSQISGLDLFKPIYIKLWQLCQTKYRQVIKIDQDFYFFNGTLNFNGDKTTLDYLGDNNHKQHISDLKQYVVEQEDISKIGCVIKEKVPEFISKQIEQEIKVFISNLYLPQYFQPILDIQLPKWINNLFVANAYQEKVQYVKNKGMIKPVDYFSTGQILDSTNWQDGLHQFLQIKHNLRLTSESFTSNFLSNIGYFKKYGKNIIGLSGTLGSKHAQEVLKKTYNVSILTIPDIKEKQFVEYPIAILPNQQEQITEICNSAIDETKQQRAVLIICETINFVEKIHQNLLTKYESRLLKLYHMNNMNLEQKIQNISAGEIIVATNLAGRGTDIKADQIQNQGGLHVILTFLPDNQRVEEQAFGRTSRNGQKGTGQMILNKLNLPFQGNHNRQQLKQLRDDREEKILKEFLNSQMKMIEIKDDLFKMFNEDLNNYRQKLAKIKKSTTVLIHFSIQDVEEEWAVLLNSIENEQITKEQAKQKYESFKNRFKMDFQIKNPFNYISIGNELLIQNRVFLGIQLNSEAKKYFKSAIKLDNNNLAAYFGLGCLKILKDKLKAKGFFSKAKEITEREINILKNTILDLIFLNSDNSSDLFKQQLQQINMLEHFYSNLKNNIKEIEKSERLIRITKIINNSRNCSKNIIYQKQVFNKIKLEDVLSKFEGEQHQRDDYEIMFRNLTASKDILTIDQAKNIIENFQKELGKTQVLEFAIESQKIQLNQIQSIIKLFEINLQFKNLNHQQCQTIFSSISSKTIDLNLKVQYSDIKTILLNNTFINDIEVTHEENGALITLCTLKDVEKQVVDLNSFQNISIRNLDFENAKAFINSLPNTLLFNLKFNNAIIEKQEKIDFNTKTEFIKLKQEDSKKVIDFFRQQQIQFNIKFKKLQYYQIRNSIQEVRFDQMYIKINGIQFLNQIFFFSEIPQNELDELKLRGIDFIIYFNERSSKKWTILSLCQVNLLFYGIGCLALIINPYLFLALWGMAYLGGVSLTVTSTVQILEEIQSNKQMWKQDYGRNQIANYRNYNYIVNNFQILENEDFNKMKPEISEILVIKFKQFDKQYSQSILFEILCQMITLQKLFPKNQIYFSILKIITKIIDSKYFFINYWKNISKSLTSKLLNFEELINKNSLSLIIQSEVNKNENIDRIIQELTLSLANFISKQGFLKIIESQGINNQVAKKIKEDMLKLQLIKQLQINEKIMLEIIDPFILIGQVDQMSQELDHCSGKIIDLLQQINQYRKEFNILFESQIQEIANALADKIISILEKVDLQPNVLLQNLKEGQVQDNTQINVGELFDENVIEDEFEIIE